MKNLYKIAFFFVDFKVKTKTLPVSPIIFYFVNMDLNSLTLRKM